MNDLSSYIVPIVMIFTLIWFCYRWHKQHKEYNDKIQKNLEDNYIIDPKTGTKITLEQAESGFWAASDNKLNITSESDIQKLYTEEEKQIARTLNYFKTNFLKLELDKDQWFILEQTKIVDKYQNFEYHTPFKVKNGNGIFFLAEVVLGESNDIPYHIGTLYLGCQIMFWLTVDVNLGHYYFREKTSTEKILDKMKSDDDFKLINYETFAFKKTNNIEYVSKILEYLEQEKGFEIEFMDTNIFIKNLKHANLEDMHKIKNMVERISTI
jgi:hypothetical protein